ncbi:MAG TPA: hypothetical protein PK543_00810 [Candidatus Saccharibacteria bacterium]|nr:hypothetical protein [Candidatus Saccharibacteria bacterium]
MANKILNKQLFKKWWFWVIVVVVLGLIGLATGGDQQTNTTTNTSPNSSQATGTLPIINKADYTDKEGLVAFKELTTKGYTVTAKYVNEAVPATNQDLTEQFTSADVNSCQDRLGFDAYLVSDVTQTGDSVALTLTNKPTNNQTCPSGTTDDL